MKEYDNYYKTKSKMLLNVYKATLINLINHGVLQEDSNVINAIKIINNEIELKKNEDLDKWKQEYDYVFSKEQPNKIDNIDKQISILEEKTNKLKEPEKLLIKSLLTQIQESLKEYNNYSKWAKNDTIYKQVEQEFLDQLTKIEKFLATNNKERK